MTFRRRVAVGISAFVVRRASPGCKEWAEGLAREVDFIASDWAALWWALGSTRVLLDYREAPIQSLDEVPAMAEKFVEEARSGVLFWLLFLFGVPYVLLGRLLNEKHLSPTELHINDAFYLAALGLAAAYSVMNQIRLKDPSKDYIYYDVPVCAQFYKLELERSQWYSWVPQTMLFCCYSCLMDVTSSMKVTAILVPVFVVLPTIWLVRRNRRRIERIDELLGERV